MRQFKLFFVLLFAALTSLQGQDLVTRYLESEHNKGETRYPDWDRKVEKMKDHRQLVFVVEGGYRIPNTDKYVWKYNGTRNFNIIAYLGVWKMDKETRHNVGTKPLTPYAFQLYKNVYGKSFNLKRKTYNGHVSWSTDTTYQFKDLTVQAARYNAFGERAGAGKKATKIKTSTSRVVIAGEAFKNQVFDIAPGAGVNYGRTYFSSDELRTKGVFRMDKALVGKTIKVRAEWIDSTGIAYAYNLVVYIVE